ncbi:MAG: dienelactone hydrolase family protein [Verrucomicrobia bacterium]|nr:dienelactone hydrolase family protein [Verrucomicrobiota bacterium]
MKPMLVAAGLTVLDVGAAEPVLPGTAPLDWPEKAQAAMADRLMDGAHRFVDRKMAEAKERRKRHWHHDTSGNPAAYAASVADNRRELARILGVVDPREPVVLETWGTENAPALVAETPRFAVWQVRWPVLAGGGGVWGEGLWVEPRGAPTGAAVVVPDADQTPEQVLGLAPGGQPGREPARGLADQGYRLVIPTLVNRQTLDTAALDIPERSKQQLAKRKDQTHREWLYRQSYHLGRHVIGYEIQKVLAAGEWLKQRGGAGTRVGVVGVGEGGLVAFHAAAVETVFAAAWVGGYFDSREQTWTEPVYRNVWALLDRFGDAEVATLIAPRGLVIEDRPVAEVAGHKGEIRRPPFERVRREFDRISDYLPNGFQPRALVRQESATPERTALAEFIRLCGGAAPAAGDSAVPEPLVDRRRGFDPEVRQQRQVRQIEDHVQRLIRQAAGVRDRFFGHKVMPALGDIKWSTEVVHPTHPPAPFVEGSKWFRNYFRDEVQGSFNEPLLPPQARTRLIHETERWVAYDVVLDVFPELVAWGVLVLPRDLAAGERRPVVVTQHGRNGLPENLLVKEVSAYRQVAARLAERGFIAFIPHNLYRNEARYRPLNRKANTVKATLYSFLVHQHDQILRWLNTLPFVDGARIAFYGNSFGGESALRLPPVLEGYALSISASYFNQWTRKVAGLDHPFSYLFSDEWEVPVFNAGNTFDHSELAYLMVPRPFMVERGHHDFVSSDEWVAHEYGRVRRLYDLLGLGDRTTIEFFQGGHGFRMEGTFDFLHRHLRWPKPAAAR